VAFVNPYVVFNWTGTGVAIDFTIRISAPQFERSQFANAFVATSGSIATFGAVPKGLLCEETRSNSIKNSTNVGAVVGSPGTQPTGWTFNLTGLTGSIIATGTETGISFVDIRFNGTTSGTSFTLNFGATTDIAAANGQTWTQSFYMKLTAGSLTNVTSLNMVQQLYDSTPTFLIAGTQTITPISGVPLAQSRFVFPYTIATANTAYNYPYIKFNCGSGVAIDVTFRIGGVQMEQGLFATSFIPTTSAAVQRNLDLVTASAPWYNSALGTLNAEWVIGSRNTVAAGVVPVPLQLDDGTANNLVALRLPGSGNQNSLSVFISNASSGGITGTGTWIQGAINKLAGLYGSNAEVVLNGGTVSTAAQASLPTGINRIDIGSGRTVALSGWMRRARYWNFLLADAQLQQVTALNLTEDAIIDLDFVNSAAAQTNNILTFTRNTVGTYYNSSGVLTTAAAGVPRFDYDPVTLLPKGYLTEETRTNLALRSTDLSNASWSKTGSGVVAPTVTANAATAPDGTVSAASIAYPAVSTASNFSVTSQGIAVTAAVYTYSFYLKGAVGGETVYLSASPDGVTYYRQQCVLTTAWQRYSLITSALTAATWFFQLGTDRRDASQSATSAQTIYAWGAQVELGTFPTSYIPTTTGSVQRNGDQLLACSTGFAMQQQGTLVVDAQIPQQGGARTLLGFSGTGNKTTLNVNASNSLAIFDTTGGLNAILGAQPINTVFRAGYAFQNGTQRGAFNGGNPNSATVATLGTNYQFTIGFDGTSGGQQPCGWIRRARYFPRVFSAAELVTVTT
jgi:hypothetical protein